MNLTPIYIQYQPSYLTPEAIPEEVDEDEVRWGEPIYSIVINAPVNPNLVGHLPFPSRRLVIPADGVIRLSLPPTVGFGVNSSYRVEYYYWRPVIYPEGFTPVSAPAQRLRTEYWRVPNRLGQFYLSLEQLVRGEAGIVPTEQLSVVRGLDRIDALPAPVFSIQKISAGDVIYSDYALTSVGIKWGEVRPAFESSYTVHYYKPFNLIHLLYSPQEQAQTLVMDYAQQPLNPLH